MTETDRLTLSCRLAALSVFRNLLQDAAVKSLWHFLQEPEPLTQRMAWYGAFVNALSESGEGLSEHLLRLICEDENAYVRAVAKGEKVPEGWRIASVIPSLQKGQGGSGKLQASELHLCPWKGDGKTCSGCHLQAIGREGYKE